MSPTAIRGFMAFVAGSALLGFLYLYGNAVYLAWFTDPAPQFKPAYVYVATALAGLIGGVVAMIFNEKLPDDPTRGPGAPPLNTPSKFGPAAARQALLNSVAPGRKFDVLAIISAAYVIAYFVAGLATIATWIRTEPNTPDLIKNLALISIGLLLAIGRSFFNVPKPA